MKEKKEVQESRRSKKKDNIQEGEKDDVVRGRMPKRARLVAHPRPFASGLDSGQAFDGGRGGGEGVR